MREKKSTKRKTSGLRTRINLKTKKKDVFLRAINIMTKTTNLKFPMMFAKAVCELEDGGSLEDIINKYSFHQESFIRTLKCLKFIMNSSRDKRKLPSLRIRLLLPKIHKSFADISSQICYVPSMKSSSYKDLRERLEALSVSRNFQHGSIQRRKNRNTASDLESPSNSQCSSSSSTQMAQISQISSNKAVKGKATKRSKACKNPQACLFCHQSGDREVELGKLHSIGKIYVHYYCLLFSSALEQNGQDNEGILGFLAKDILKELKRGEKLKCCYCNQKGATIGCNSKNCKKTYHFPCGLDNFSQFVFKDNFSSMCVKHRKFQQGYNKGKEVECPICMETMLADPKFAVWAPCCRKASWFHKLCIQKLALNAGYFFKCPLCNDKNIFTPEMLAQGIFVPDQDASWELEPNAFQELLERPIRCDVPKCKCPGGRKNDDEGTRWEILLCTLCGSTGTHILCSQLKFNCREWHCTTCVSMLRESALRAQQESRTRRVVGRKRRKVYHEESPPSSEEEEEGSDRKRLRRSSDLPLRSPRPSSSSCRASRDTDDEDDVVSVPEGIRGDLVIRDLVTLEGESSLSDALIEMKSYANSFPNKLAEANFSEGQFLDVINAITSESGGGQAYVLEEEHLRKFIDCSFNYDQMRVLRKSFELFLIIHYLKKNVSRACSRKKNNPFLSSPSRTSFKLKKLKDFQRSLTSNLIKAKSANLFQGNTTWSTYSTPVSKPKKPSCQLNPKEGVTINSTVVSGGDEENEPSSSQSTSYIRRLTVRRLSEKCEFCNMQLNPGTMPTTLFLAAGTLEIICTSCLSCNAFCGIFPKVSPPNAQGVVKSTEKTTPDKFSANLSKSPKASKVKVATVSNQASICDYFSTRTKVTPSPAKPATAPPHAPLTSASKGRNPSCANISSEKKDCESRAKNGSEDSAVCSLSTPKPKAGAVEAKLAVPPPPKAHLEEKPVNKAFYEVAPPVHSIMPISTSSITCKCCSMIEVAESERKMSKLYCPCCEDVPSFCSRDHFNLYHTFTHNWMLIPPINGNQKPNKLCKVCKEKKLTRFYCPACPWDVGYCSLAHYKEIHTKEKMLTNRMPTVDFRKKEENLKRERIRDVRIKKDEQPITEPSSLDEDILQLGKEISQRFQASNSFPDAANSLISTKFPEIPDHANSQRSVKFKEIPDDANSLRSMKFKEIPDDANSLRSMKFKEIPDDANSLRSVKFKEIPNDANSLRSVKFKEIPDGENLQSLKKFRITKKEESVGSVPSQKETGGSRSSSSLDDPDLWLKKNQIVSSDSASAAGPLLVRNKAADAPNLVGSVATDEQESKLDSSRLPVTISTSDPQKTQESGSLEHESVIAQKPETNNSEVGFSGESSSGTDSQEKEATSTVTKTSIQETESFINNCN